MPFSTLPETFLKSVHNFLSYFGNNKTTNKRCQLHTHLCLKLIIFKYRYSNEAVYIESIISRQEFQLHCNMIIFLVFKTFAHGN